MYKSLKVVAYFPRIAKFSTPTLDSDYFYVLFEAKSKKKNPMQYFTINWTIKLGLKDLISKNLEWF